MKEFPELADDLAAQRHERLRRTAPAVQHEINNALMVLAANLDLLGRSLAEGAPRRQLDRALAATRRLDAAMRGFLDAARRPLAEPALVSPGQALTQALPLLGIALGARHGIDLALGEGIWPVRLDAARFDLALLTLVQDALPGLPPGARIGLAVANRAAEVALTVSLPDGLLPSVAAQAALAAAVALGGGRIEAGPVLIWPKA
jgi:signal transduction histidine kinase